jgi:hypothetical protein
VDLNANGVNDPGEAQPLPSPNRGFDDPQADPTPGLVLLRTIRVRYVRGDLFSLPPTYTIGDATTGNPPWGSQPGDADADAVADAIGLADRKNQGMYPALYDNDKTRSRQQLPNDAFGEPSCPFPALASPCDVYTTDCGGLAHYGSFKGYPPSGPTGFDPYPSGTPDPPSPPDWPVVPFPRDWVPGDTPSAPVIKKLLRFASSIVSYDSTQPAATAYRLEEDAKNVVVTAPGTPLAGSLIDAYNYFKNSVFQQPDDPAIDCRNHIIVFITDGIEECEGSPCRGAGLEPGNSSGGPSKDLGLMPLPESAPGLRVIANSLDPSVRVSGVPVYVVALGIDPFADPDGPGPLDPVSCIADNSGGRVFLANDRSGLQDALESILDFKRTANFFAAPSVPAFASGFGDSAHIGAVIPSHENVNGDLSQWSIWNGSLKSFKLDANGNIPVVTAAPPTATPTPTPGGPTVTPVVGTPTPTPTGPGGRNFPDETAPDDSVPSDRNPVWNAGRVLGYTDPVASLGEGAGPVPAAPPAKAPEIDVWPGRKMVWAQKLSAGAPLTRQDFLPNTAPCSGACFDALTTAMGLNPAVPADLTLAERTVQFLRGGITANGSRDEVLNLPGIKPPGPTIGPGPGEEQKFSYFYQDDAPSPGSPPQVRTDDDGTPPAGYSHKLGDIFHSEPWLLEPPRYLQYLSLNLEPRPGQRYGDFAALHAKRRKVLFVGSNDGFAHAFDAGVHDRDDGGTFDDTHDLGTGREIFAYAPRAVMTGKYPNLLAFPPKPQYFVDGSSTTADVFIDPVHAGTPTAGDRLWRTVLVGSLRQGGAAYYALDVTQPDNIDTAVGPSFGAIVGSKDASPGCLNGGGSSCVTKYPEVLWELTDNTIPRMGESWSRAVIGRIKVIDGGAPSGFSDKYVAIFGGGFDPTHDPGDPIRLADGALPATRGRAIYLVDVETGVVLHKATAGVDGAGNPVDFAPMPATAGVVDYDNDGYLDIAHIGDVSGRMWRFDLTPDPASTPPRGELVAGALSGYEPFLLYDASTSVTAPIQPIFQEPGVIYVSGGPRPKLGVAWGSGDRAELALPNFNINRFHFVFDDGQTTTTFQETDLRNLTPAGGVTPSGAGPGPDTEGFFLDFASANEKASSTVYSTVGFLTLLTFTPDQTNPCATEGNSFQYRFFFLNGQGGYNIGSPAGDFTDYRVDEGSGLASFTQSTTPKGRIKNMIMRSDGSIDEEIVPGSLQTLSNNWKEQ